MSSDDYLKYSKGFLVQSPSALAYLKGRGISSRQVDKYQIGYFPIDVKLNGEIDVYKGRISFPLKDEYGDLRGFSLRRVENREKGNHTKIELESLKGYVYGLNEAVEEAYKIKTLLLVEGPHDLMAVEPYFPACAAMLTSNLTKEAFLKVTRYVERILFCYDNDETGMKQRENAKKWFQNKVKLSILDYPHKDPSEWKSKNKDAFKNYFLNLKEIYS